MTPRSRIDRSTSTSLLTNGAISVLVLLLVFAAFDDITTDNATTFRFEYTILLGCSGWLLFVAWDLLRRDHRALGGASLLALASAVWAQREIGPGITPGPWPEYIVMTAAYIWFCVLAVALLWLGWQARRATPGNRPDPS